MREQISEQISEQAINVFEITLEQTRCADTALYNFLQKHQELTLLTHEFTDAEINAGVALLSGYIAPQLARDVVREILIAAQIARLQHDA